MKFIYIANARIPTEKAHGIQIMKMCEAFSDLGNDVKLIVPRRLNPIKEDPFEYYSIKRNFKITRLPTIDLVSLGKVGFLVQTWSFSEVLFWFLLFFRNFDVLYSRDALPLLSPTFLWKEKCFFEAHKGSDHPLVLSVLGRVQGIVAISEGVKKFFVKRGIQSGKIFVAHDGVDMERFDVRETKEGCRKRLGFPLDKKIVMYTGHLYERKGVSTLAESAKKLEEMLFVFVGGTDRDIKRFKGAYGGQENILILGHKKHSDIPFFLKSADVLVLPNSAKSKDSSVYTSPMKLFEYMASCVPIVASDVPAVREILNDSRAFLVEPDDSRKLADVLKDLFVNEGEAVQKAKKAQNEVKVHTWLSRAEHIVEFMKS